MFELVKPCQNCKSYILKPKNKKTFELDEFVRRLDLYNLARSSVKHQSKYTKLILKAVELNIPILGICNGFQIFTQMNLLPGKLVLNDCGTFVCKREKVDVVYYDVPHRVELCIANSYGKYIHDNTS